MDNLSIIKVVGGLLVYFLYSTTCYANSVDNIAHYLRKTANEEEKQTKLIACNWYKYPSKECSDLRNTVIGENSK